MIDFSNKIAKRFTIAAAFFVLMLIYLHHFNNGYFYDSVYCVEQNPAIHSLKNIPYFFENSAAFANIDAYRMYRPFFLVSYAIDYAIGHGLNPIIIHWHTFLWFIGLCILLFFFISKIFIGIVSDNFYPALLATCLFAFHPTTADVVNYMYARSDLFGALYAMLGIIMYLYWPFAKKYYLYIIPIFIACLFKIVAGIFLPLLGFYLLYFTEDEGTIFSRFKKLFVKFIPASIVLLIAFCLTVFHGKTPDLFGVTRETSLLTQAHVVLNYFMLFFLPENINPNGWRNFVTSPMDSTFITGMVFLVIICIVTYLTALKKETKPISFGLLWFLIFQLPISGLLILPIPQVDYYSFNSMMGIAIAVTGLVVLVYKRMEHSQILPQAALVLGCLAVLTTFAYGSKVRVGVWSSEKTMWEDVLKKDPTNGRVLMNYGTILMSEGNLKDAEDYFERAKQYWPGYDLIYVNLGIVKNQSGDTTNAENNFKTAVALNGWDYYMSCYFYGSYLHSRKRDAEAVTQLTNALKRNPSYADAGHLLMDIYLNEKNKALGSVCRQFLNVAPDDEVAKKYLAVYNQDSTAFNGSTIAPVEMEQYYLSHPTADNYINLSLIYFNQKQFNKVIDACGKALAIDPKSALAYNNMCAAYNNLKQWDNAINAGKKALEIQPDFERAKNNLNFALNQKQQGK